MWEISLALAAAIVSQPQAATLEGCEFIEQRWICRYRIPDIQLVTAPPDAPETLNVRPPDSVAVTPAAPGMGATASPSIPMSSPDPGVLTEAQASLVARCAEARWYSLCLPSQRVEARRLREAAQAYEAARLRVGGLISEGNCDEALSLALTGGYFGLARESQALCAGQSENPSTTNVVETEADSASEN